MIKLPGGIVHRFATLDDAFSTSRSICMELLWGTAANCDSVSPWPSIW